MEYEALFRAVKEFAPNFTPDTALFLTVSFPRVLRPNLEGVVQRATENELRGFARLSENQPFHMIYGTLREELLNNTLCLRRDPQSSTPGYIFHLHGSPEHLAGHYMERGNTFDITGSLLSYEQAAARRL
jgi:hypothetical protein